MTKFRIAEINPAVYRETTLSSQLRKVLSSWMAFASRHYSEWPEKPGCGYFFSGSYCYGIDNSATAMTAAALCSFGKFNENLLGITKEKLIEMTIGSIRYLCYTHHTGPKGLVRVTGKDPRFSNKKWGYTPGNFFMTSQTGVSVSMLGLAAWLLWDRLDDETRTMTAEILEFYADEFSSMTPKSGTYNDTQCEENAWTSLGIAAAYYMFPDHPNSDKWRDGYINWSLNTVTTYKDKLENELCKVSGDTRGGFNYKGKTYGISSVTFHPDFTTENHGYVHPDYMGGGIILRISSVIFPLLRGKEPFSSLFYNFENLYEKVLKPWCAEDGNPVPVQGQDWFYHRHQNKIIIHAAMNLFFSDPDAAMFERKCMDIMFRRQESTGKGNLLEKNGDKLWVTPGRQTAMDMEYGAIRTVVLTYIMHLILGDGVDPEYPSEVMKKLSGNHIYPYGGAYIYRTPDTFASFTTRCSIMGISQPSGGLWEITSDFQGFTGIIRQEKTDDSYFNDKKINWSDIGTHCTREKSTVYEKGFSIITDVPRAAGAVSQLVSFSALPDGRVVYVEKSRAVTDVDISTYETGRIGIGNENFRFIPEYATGYRDIYFNGVATRFYGSYGGNDLVVEHRGLKHVNVNDNMGYLLFGSNGVKYINRHDYPKWKGLEDTLILNNRKKISMNAGDTTDIFAVVALPNTGIYRMDKEYSDTDITVSGADEFVIRMHENRVSVNFSDEGLRVEEKVPVKMGKIRIFYGRTVVSGGECSCMYNLDAFTSRVDGVVGMIKLRPGGSNLEISCFEGFITVRNTGEHDAEYTFSSLGRKRDVIHPAGDTIELMVMGDA